MGREGARKRQNEKGRLESFGKQVPPSEESVDQPIGTQLSLTLWL